MRALFDARWAPVLALLVACAKDTRERAVAWLFIESADVEPEAIDALDALRVAPPEAFVRAIRSGPRVVVGIDVRASTAGVRVDVPGSCPIEVAPSELVAGAAVHKMLAPRVELQAPQHPRDLGYDAPFAVDAVARCGPRAPSNGNLVWRQLSGPALRDVRAAGLHFEARTSPAAEQDVAGRPAWGIVPVSSRACGEIVLEATWRPRTGEQGVARRRVTLAAASRSRGLPNVAVDDGILLAGRGWIVQSAPRGAALGLHAAGDLSALTPDVSGTWLLRDADGQALTIHAGRYDETPLDCGRAPCHASIAAAAQQSPMTQSLHHLATGARSCAIACHATGEPSGHDGGFSDLARTLGTVVGETAWDDLPPAMHRVGGVTCLGCHGPGAIPEASGRWAILRSDVCATCHDAPPTYGHVAAWRSSRMARSDADPRARSSGECARCHTTSGFLASLRGERDTRAQPAFVPASGIACAGCHAPHAARDGQASSSLVRQVPTPAWLDGIPVGKTSSVCVPCHSPATSELTIAPRASAASIWAGRGGVDPQTGAPLSTPAIHAGVPGGCTGCHRDGPPELERGRGHAFQPDMASCEACHSGAMPDVASVDRRIGSDARTLLAELSRRGAFGDPTAHASGAAAGHAADRRLTRDRLGRAAYDVLLVAEDPAAGTHNAPFARALLGAAERAIAAEGAAR